MATMRDIKRRKESVTSTGQITKAMKLVATVKMQKAKTRAVNSLPYFRGMYNTVKSIIEKSHGVSHPYIDGNGEGKKAIIMITSNRGLAGGYNSNVIKLIANNEEFNKDNTVLYAIGKKGITGTAKYGYEVVADYSDAINEPLFSDAIEIGNRVLKDYEEGKINEVYLAYTVFKNTVTHIPTLTRLLPFVTPEDAEMEAEHKEETAEDRIEALTLMNFEPEAEEALNMIIPKYINSLIFGALIQAVASENGARMQAMDSATSNAEDMIADLELKYNRARQSAITQELTEIIAGSAAVE
ncbi:MAG: ATP synthase F1 subunit gamma [Lachnospiraceae bacterium]|nr:ATP synthase F1 subunit gamma [Lachnospiraceae bacterium]